jgi:hypothetical protein
MATWKDAIKQGEVIDHRLSESFILGGSEGEGPYDIYIRTPECDDGGGSIDESTVDQRLSAAGINDDNWVIDPEYPHK